MQSGVAVTKSYINLGWIFKNIFNLCLSMPKAETKLHTRGGFNGKNHSVDYKKVHLAHKDIANSLKSIV